MQLACYGPENLLLTDEVLEDLSTSWDLIQKKIDVWLGSELAQGESQEKQLKELNEFKKGCYDRIGFKIKDSRNTLLSFTGSAKAWEIIVGQAIAKLEFDNIGYKDNSIYTFLGKELVELLGSIKNI